jgi:dTDP-4-dehydrorhamnose reductase
MKIIILGSNGMLGSMLSFLAKRYNKDIIPLSRKEFDVERDDIHVLEKYFKEACCVVNCIGAIPQKKCTDVIYKLLNTDFPLELATLCEKHSIPLIHVSTNCVFSGKDSDCLETDIPDAIDMYGLSKYQGEPPNSTVIRCSIIGPERNTSFGLMEWFLSKNGIVTGYTDHYWNGLTTLELSKIILNIIDQNKFTKGIQHLYSQNTVSKFDLLNMISKNIHSECNIIPIENGIKFYTLSSIINNSTITIDQQLTELFDIVNDYKALN